MDRRPALSSPRLRFILHRTLIAVPVLFGVTLLTFFVLDLLPGDTATQLLGADATPQKVAQLELQLGLNRPAAARYWEWLRQIASGDLGRSLASHQPVASLIGERLPVSGELLVCAFVLSLAIAVPAALLAARWPNGFADRITLLGSMVGVSLSSYVLAFVLVLLFSIRIPALPSIGFTALGDDALENLRHLVLPTLAVALPLLCFYTRFLRSDLIEQLRSEDYVVTARAKGLGPWKVLLRHVLRNSVFGLLTVVALNLGTLLGGMVVVEQIFSLPGIGALLLLAVNTRDAPVVQAIVLLLSVVTVLANLAVDLLYAALDPRIAYEQH
jgi:peptide/nickel transport system permease protein